MAHTLDIPIEFKFEVEPAIWLSAVAKPVGCFMGGDLIAEVVEPYSYAGIRALVRDSTRHLFDLSKALTSYIEHVGSFAVSPISVGHKKGHPLSKSIEQEFGDQRIEVLICDHPNRSEEDSLVAFGLGPVKLPTKAERIDAWRLREEFFRLPARNAAHLVRFLTRWGVWSQGAKPSRAYDEASEWEPSFSLADSIWSDRERFIKGLQTDPAEWLSTYSLGQLEARSKFPHFVRLASTCRDAIESTITFDLMQGSEFRLCALKDCGLPFKLESGHKRKFCSQYHAHLASVRRIRKKAAHSKGKSRAKVNKHGQ